MLQDAHAHGGVNTIEMGGKGRLGGMNRDGERTMCGWDVSVQRLADLDEKGQ